MLDSLASLANLAATLVTAWRETRKERTASREKLKTQLDAAVDARDWARVAVLAVRLRRLL